MSKTATPTNTTLRERSSQLKKNFIGILSVVSIVELQKLHWFIILPQKKVTWQSWKTTASNFAKWSNIILLYRVRDGG